MFNISEGLLLIMNFKFISEDLTEKGLNNCELEVLVPNNHNYHILAYQHKGDVEGDNQEEMYVRHVDQDLATIKFNHFISLASERNVELAISPEYSCPWASIQNAIEKNIFPNFGKIWILGCESIMPSELKELIDENNSDELYFIYDTDIVESEEQKFVDPLCYVFRTKPIDNNHEVTVIAIQFKTYPMGGIPFEQEGMLRGNYGYRFKNNGASINLISIICSDALGISEKDLTDLDLEQSFLILHLQLNRNVRNYNFERYRLFLFNRDGKDSNKDILTLNWSRNSTISGRSTSYGGSTYFMKSTKVNEEDTRINNNDHKGVFYSYWEKAYVNTYFFDYDEYVFLLRTDKASIQEPIENKMKRGPEIINRFKWNENTNQWNVFNEPTCDLTKCCTELEERYDFNSIIGLGNNSVNMERLICLANGNVYKKQWYKPKSNFNFLIDNGQVNNRVVFHHDPDTTAQQNKEISIARFGEMVTAVVSEPTNFPERFADLRNDCKIIYVPDPDNLDSYSINAQSQEGVYSTLVYLGVCLERQAEEKLKLIGNQFKESQGAKRILIWYNSIGLQQKFLPDEPSISENSSQNRVSYKRTKE